jgi:AbrB family looped-hinge helix DNA binding protein
MRVGSNPNTVRFTTKGQVVIPLRLRKAFHIEDGTRAVLEARPEGILLKPITDVSIGRGRGLLKRKPNHQSLAADWAAHKQEERELEETKHGVPRA